MSLKKIIIAFCLFFYNCFASNAPQKSTAHSLAFLRIVQLLNHCKKEGCPSQENGILPEINHLLVQNPSLIQAQDNEGNTLLMIGLTAYNPCIQQLLYHHQPDVNKKNKAGQTPSHIAMSSSLRESYPTYKELIDHKADQSIVNSEGLTPIQVGEKKLDELTKRLKSLKNSLISNSNISNSKDPHYLLSDSNYNKLLQEKILLERKLRLIFHPEFHTGTIPTSSSSTTSNKTRKTTAASNETDLLYDD